MGAGAYAALSSPIGGPFLGAAVLAAIGVMLLSFAVASHRSVQWAIGIVATTYIASLLLGGVSLDPWSPLVAASLLASTEFAHWSIDSRLPAVDERQVHTQRGLAVGLLISAGLALAAIVLAGSQIGPLAGNAATAAATGAIALALAGVGLVAWRVRRAEVATRVN